MHSILLVDDEPIIRNGIRRNYPWAELGFAIRWEASDGEEALRIAQAQVPDVILTDIVMRRMSGIELAKGVRNRMLPTQIVFLSGYRDFEYARDALSFGVFRYILKPIDTKELLGVFTALGGVLGAEGGEQDAQGMYERIVSDVKRYLCANLPSASLQSAADHVSMSVSHLSRIFKASSGISFSQYLTDARMERARELLSDGRKMIYEIAGEIGYDSPQNFTRAFKRAYGVTPQEHRLTPFRGARAI